MDNKVSSNDSTHYPTWRLHIRSIAQAKGFNVESLATASGISLECIRSIWEEPKFDTSLSTLNTLASILGVDINALIEDTSIIVEPPRHS